MKNKFYSMVFCAVVALVLIVSWTRYFTAKAETIVPIEGCELSEDFVGFYDSRCALVMCGEDVETNDFIVRIDIGESFVLERVIHSDDTCYFRIYNKEDNWTWFEGEFRDNNDAGTIERVNNWVTMILALLDENGELLF